jgi:excisionase family DNA binding protein
MKSWLKRQIAELTELQAHPEPDRGVFEGCACVVREAADRAAKDGFIDLYERHKKTRFCTPRDALAVLNAMLAALQPTGDSSAPMTVKEASERYGIPERTIYALCKDGQLVHHRVGTGRGRILIRSVDLDQHLRQSRVEAQSTDSVDYLFDSPD